MKVQFANGEVRVRFNRNEAFQLEQGEVITQRISLPGRKDFLLHADVAEASAVTLDEQSFNLQLARVDLETLLFDADPREGMKLHTPNASTIRVQLDIAKGK